MLLLPGVRDAGYAVRIPPCPPPAKCARTATINQGNGLVAHRENSTCRIAFEGCATTPPRDTCQLARAALDDAAARAATTADDTNRTVRAAP
jgi:hypothetical protein